MALKRSLGALALYLYVVALAQWIYPPAIPSGKTISDYASGVAISNITYAAGDSILGSFEPAQVDLYVLYRCTHTPVTSPIYPSNLSISSSDPVVAADGTWEWPWTYLSWAYTNAYTPGQDVLYFSGLPDPKISGSLCWFELSTGTDATNQQPPFNRSISLNGSDTAHHYVTMPFNVEHEAAVNTTWTTGGQNASQLYPSGLGFTLSGGTIPTATATTSSPSAKTNTASWQISTSPLRVLIPITMVIGMLSF